MATINLIDDFWVEITELIAKVGNRDLAIGNVVRFFRHAQERHRKGRIITETEFKEQGFFEELIPVFARRTPDGIVAVGASKHFDWLIRRTEAAAEAGRASGEARRNKINGLARTSSNVVEPNPTSMNSLALSLAFTESKNTTSSADAAPPPSRLHPLAASWNSLVPSLPKVVSTTGTARAAKIRAALKVRAREAWEELFRTVEASDFLSGRDGRWTGCGFDWALKETNAIKVLEGNYNREAKSAAEKPSNETWTGEAMIFINAVLRFNEYQAQAMYEHLGVERTEVLKRIGGRRRISEMPNTDFARRALANELKSVWESFHANKGE